MDPSPAARAVASLTEGTTAPSDNHHRTVAARVDMVQKAARTQRRPRPGGPTFDEVGTTGLRHYGGFVVEEWLAQLSGRRGQQAYREMADNDPVVGAVLFAIEMLARGVDWRVEPGADEQATMLVETGMDDMSHTWPDLIAEIFSTMLPGGWDLHEIVYKRRLGPDPGNKLPGSRYDDGLIGWRKLPTRAPETLEQWVFSEEDGGLEAMVQVAFDGARRIIPMEKALLFRTTTRRNNPEGRSILRTGWIPFFRKKNMEEIEAIGVERDLAGIPVMKAPEGFNWPERLPDGEWSDPASAAIVAAAEELVTAIRRDEDEGVVLPPGWVLELLSTGGSRQLDTNEIITRYNKLIATTVLADFVLMAQDKVGSYSLGKAKIDTFGQAMQAWLSSIAEVFNRYAIPRLLKLNGMSVVDPPRLVPGEVSELDVEQVAAFVQNMHLAGAPIPWEQWLPELAKKAQLPEPEEGEDEQLPTPRDAPTDAELEGEVPGGDIEGTPAPAAVA